jgi:hypothetical protein
MRRRGIALALVVGTLVTLAAVAVADEKVKILDACDPANLHAYRPPRAVLSALRCATLGSNGVTGIAGQQLCQCE